MSIIFIPVTPQETSMQAELVEFILIFIFNLYLYTFQIQGMLP